MTALWPDDACSLVDAFRAGKVSPLEALDDCIEAIQRSPLNAFSHTDFDQARHLARGADALESVRVRLGVTTVSADAPLDEVFTPLLKGEAAVTIVDGVRPVGVITRADLLEYVAHHR